MLAFLSASTKNWPSLVNDWVRLETSINAEMNDAEASIAEHLAECENCRVEAGQIMDSAKAKNFPEQLLAECSSQTVPEFDKAVQLAI